MDVMKDACSVLWVEWRRAALDMSLGWLPALLDLEAWYEKSSVLPQSGGGIR